MARWKARIEFLFAIVELFSLALTVKALQGKTCQDSLLSGGVSQFHPRFQVEGVVPGEYFLVSTKLDTLLSDSANCTVLRAVVLTQYRRVTDRQADRRTEGIAVRTPVASTTLAMRALRRAVKSKCLPAERMSIEP